METGDPVLIAAQSGRALAQAARRAGLVPYVLDLFGDADTLEAAQAHRPMPGRFGTGRVGARAVLAALDALAEAAGRRPVGLVLGSGFEGAPDLVAALGARHRLLGAGAEAVRAAKDPQGLARLCARLAIRHPAIAVAPVADPGRWLCKRVGGSGGGHVRAAGAGAPPPGCYFQARVPGLPRSLNFVAGGTGIAVLALTGQWTAPSRLRPFRYGGALAPGRNEPPHVTPSVLAEIVAAVERLSGALGLRGLASADLLVDGSDWWLVEVNPRPGATLDVLDRRAEPLFALHVAACLGGTPRPGPAPVDAAGAEICYAPRAFAVTRAAAWPDFVRDRPRLGSRVARDAPFCTVTATAADAAAARRTLRERARLIARFSGGESDGGCEAAERQRVERAAHRPPGR